MPSPEQLVELTFPLGGINTETEYQLQPAETTPIAINVRSIDPVEHRSRGASRAGIRKYVDQKLGLFSLIQHLNIIVDPTIDFTLSEQDLETWVISSSSRGRLARRSNNNRRMRRGGSGVRYRNNSKSPKAEDDVINITEEREVVTIQPLDNDTYSGAPTFEVIKLSANFVGEYDVFGPIGGYSFQYTPPLPPSPTASEAAAATANAAAALIEAIDDGDPPSVIRELKAALKAAIKVEKNARKLSAAKTILVGYKLTALGNKGRSTARITINLAEIPADIYTFGPYDDTPPRWTIVLDARSLSRPERAVLSRIATDPNNGSTLIEFLAYFVDEGFSGEPPAEWGSAVMFVTRSNSTVWSQTSRLVATSQL